MTSQVLLGLDWLLILSFVFFFCCCFFAHYCIALQYNLAFSSCPLTKCVKEFVWLECNFCDPFFEWRVSATNSFVWANFCIPTRQLWCKEETDLTVKENQGLSDSYLSTHWSHLFRQYGSPLCIWKHRGNCISSKTFQNILRMLHSVLFWPV